MSNENMALTYKFRAENAEGELRRLQGEIDELVAALEGVIAVADRKTDEFDRARAAIAKAKGGQ